jgi:hypothetical protein
MRRFALSASEKRIDTIQGVGQWDGLGSFPRDTCKFCRRRRSAEPAVAPDGGGISVFQYSTSHRPPPQVNGSLDAY